MTSIKRGCGKFTVVEQHHKIVEGYKPDLQLIGMFVVGLPGEKEVKYLIL